MATDSATMDYSYDDAAGTFTSSVKDSSLTYAKLQNVSAPDRVLGRSSAGAGVVEELVCTPLARTLLDDTTQAAMQTTLGLGTAATQAYTETSFTVSCTGFGGTAPSGTARAIQVGKLVILLLPDLVGTSNANSFGILGLPAGLGVSGVLRVPVLVQDNGAFQFGIWQLAGTTLTVYPNATFSPWVASGSKAMYPTSLAYQLV